ncbi:MAG: hypothetical protein GQ569_15330 [Methylococcaceae bacterium]|nr:hypothetical protein [Methylococcaceae bacterium]
MEDENTDVFLENQALKSKFAFCELNLSEVFQATPNDLERENRFLTNLLHWVRKYTQSPNRKKLEDEGYHFPPIEPDISPDNDWYRFESWLKGKPIRLTLKEQLPEDLALPASNTLSDEEVSAVLENLIKFLEEIRFLTEFSDDIPDRLLYEHLRDSLNDEFDIINEGFWHLDGCSGHCPSCFQRPWCESGNSSCWPEDEAAGEMYITEEVGQFFSASPLSLKTLRKLQAEQDKEFEEFKNNSEDSDYDDDDDIPF